MNKWREYEARKKAIYASAVSSDDYQERIKKLVEELGL